MKTSNFIVLAILSMAFFAACNTTKKSNNKTDEKEFKTTGDNSMVSVGWTGTYQGILPCADCEGIKTQITLNEDLTYVLETKYLGRDENIFREKGSFTWGENGGKISLDNENKQNYLVGENKIFHLDNTGNRISGDLANKYILDKEDAVITDKHWQLTELDGQAIDEQKKTPFVVLNTEENRVTGNAGCNTFFGTYELTSNQGIEFSHLGMTRMACPDMELEGEFMKVFENATTVESTPNTLV